jgi:hypothetical protein
MLIRTRMCMSADGCVTTPDRWPVQVADPAFVAGQSYGFPEFQASCDAVLMGRTTFEPALSADRLPWPNLEVFVLAHIVPPAPPTTSSSTVTGNFDLAVNATGGKGGTQATGGAPGDNSDTTTTAGVGTPGTGGDGAAGALQSGGGGGGGGWFGGGGGGGALPNQGASGGGGGGSGFGPDGTTTFETGVRAGNGVLTITFEPDPAGCTTPAGVPAAEAPGAGEPGAAVAVVSVPRFTG